MTEQRVSPVRLVDSPLSALGACLPWRLVHAWPGVSVSLRALPASLPADAGPLAGVITICHRV